MFSYYDMVKASTSTSGSGSVTIGSAVSPYRGFAGIVANGATIRYLILDANGAWERGYGTFDSGTNVLTRNLECSSTGSLLSLSGSATVENVAGASDMGAGKFLCGVYSANNAATLDITGWYSSRFDLYELELFDCYPSSNSVTLSLYPSTDNGSTFDTGANFDSTALYTYGNNQNGASTAVGVVPNIVGGLVNTANYSLHASFKLSDPASSRYKTILMHAYNQHVALPGPAEAISALTWKNTAAYNALRFMCSSGNISGKARIYGLVK